MVHAHYVCKRPLLSPEPQRAARGPPGARRRGSAFTVKAAARATLLLTHREASPGLQRGRVLNLGHNHFDSNNSSTLLIVSGFILSFFQFILYLVAK